MDDLHIEMVRAVTTEQIRSYIAACEANLAKYQQIEDPIERDRAVAACEGMIADFKALIKE
jgi:hypothetical protein